MLGQRQKGGAVDATFRSHEQHPCILFNEEKESSVVERGEKQVMAAANSHALLRNQCEHFVAFEEKLFDVGVATKREEACVLDRKGRRHVAGNVGCWSLEELLVLLQPERHVIVHDAMEAVYESGIAPEHGRDGVVVAAVHNNLGR